ncbi:hypothetical protein FHG87_007698 [Trinorchestia longiramus]|nr:hypothetical protein FHG87_007698 [Trinorchestia longiramus]
MQEQLQNHCTMDTMREHRQQAQAASIAQETRHQHGVLPKLCYGVYVVLSPLHGQIPAVQQHVFGVMWGNLTEGTCVRGCGVQAPLLPLPQRDSPKFRTSSPAPNLSSQSRRALPVPKVLPPFVPPIHPSVPNITSSTTKRTTYRIQLKTIDLTKPTDKQQIFEVTFLDLDAPIIRLTKARTGYYDVTDDATTIEKLISNEAIEAFEKINLIPIEPSDIDAKRTVYVRQIDSDIIKDSVDLIETWIILGNEWLKEIGVIKIKGYTHIMKIVTPNTKTAEKILREGFNLNYTKILPQQCELEKYTHILILLEMLQIWGSSDASVHSKNTEGIINQKQDDEQKQKEQQTHNTYAEIAKHAIQQTNPPQHALTLTNQTHLKLTALILEAHIAALDKTQKFRDILSTSLETNFDIDTTFPDRDSAAIFNFYYDKTGTQQPKTKKHFHKKFKNHMNHLNHKNNKNWLTAKKKSRVLRSSNTGRNTH